MERVSWKEHRTNEDILKEIAEDRSLLQVIRTRQKNWIGHILRGDSLVRISLEGRLIRKRGRGRPSMMLLDWINKDYHSLKTLAEDRERWRNWRPEPA